MSQAEVNIIVNGAEQGAQKIQNLNKSLESTGKVSKASIVGMVGLASSASALYFQFDNLDKIQLRITKQQRLMEEQEIRVSKALKDSGKNSKEYELELRELNEVQEKLRQTQGDLVQGQIQFGLQMAGTVTQIPTMIKSITGLVVSHGAGTVATGAHATAHVGFTGAIVASSRAIWAQTAALLANPFFAIPTAVAIAASVALIATNTWGLRDAIFGTTEAIHENTRAYGQAPPAIQGATQSVNQYSAAVKQNTDLLRMWDKINSEAVSNLKKNDRSVNQFQRDLLDSIKNRATTTNLIAGTLDRQTENFRAGRGKSLTFSSIRALSGGGFADVGSRAGSGGLTPQHVLAQISERKEFSLSREGLTNKLWQQIILSPEPLRKGQPALNRTGFGNPFLSFKRDEMAALKRLGIGDPFRDISLAIIAKTISRQEIRYLSPEQSRQLITSRLAAQAEREAIRTQEMSHITEHRRRTLSMSTGVVN